jgi:hypothetical protein
VPREKDSYTSRFKNRSMASEEIAWRLRQRTEMLKENNPNLDLEWEMEEGDWGLITLRKEGDLVGFEFIESEDSWTRPDALIQYMEVANEGYYVAVVVPDDTMDGVMELLYSLGENPVSVLSYSSIGLAPLVHAS